MIEKGDLQPFNQLRYLDLSGNDLETLSSDLFDHNPLLRYFDADFNPLKTVGANIFSTLKSIEYVSF